MSDAAQGEQVHARTADSLPKSLIPPDVRSPVVNFGLIVASVGGLILLAISSVTSANWDFTHPILLGLVLLQVFAGVAALKRSWPFKFRATVLLGYFALFALLVAAYRGPTVLASFLLLTCILLSAMMFGRRAMILMLVIEVIAVTCAAVLWCKGILPLENGPVQVGPTQPLFWIQWAIAFLVGSASICALIFFLLRKLDQYYREERRMFQYLAREQQLRAQAELSRLQAEIEKRTAESEFGMLWKTTPLGLSLVRSRIFIRVNSRMSDIFGYDEQEFVGKSSELLYRDREEFLRVGEELLTGLKERGYATMEVEGRHKKGHLLHLFLTATPHGTGSIDEGYVVTCMDVSHVKRIEQAREELETAKREAEAASRAKSAFLANMSHEIRTPLNAILGFTQLLMRDKHLPQEQREQLRIIDRNGEHLLALINDILEISKIEAGRSPLNLSSVDVRRVCSDLADTFRLKAESKRIGWIVTCDPALPQWIETDPSKLRMVLINLVGNAVKFTQKGRVELRTRIADAVETGRKRVWFEVQDTGPGIAAEEQARLFQTFAQTETGRDAGGTGLGLAISRHYARMLGGDVYVDSEVGQGSVFKLWIPMEAAAGPSSPTDSRAPIEVEGRPRVLVVDDVDDNRLLLKEMLVRAGYEVREAFNGEEAVRVTDEWLPECILMDMRMPVMDGPTAMRQIREKHGQSIRILSLSASAFTEDQIAYSKAGADGFIPKPLREQDLLAALSRLLGRDVKQAKGGSCPPTPQSGGGDWLPPDNWVREIQAACREADFRALKQLLAQEDVEAHPRVKAMRIALTAFNYEEIERLVQVKP
ncbi:MAG: ATP-binding protein [Opitutaceae bacterium]|nr:ATP-binding protein [Opitutaceae bacterium]